MRVFRWATSWFTAKRGQQIPLPEPLVAGFALLALLLAQWSCATAIYHSNYFSGDGKMAQATILVALKFAGILQINTISPIEGVGSQLLPLNVWANPAYWPFAFFDKVSATDISAIIALGIFMAACYIMARCFDLAILPSVIAAQLCIVLFAPTALVLQLWEAFCLNPGNAVVYAPYMIAIGLLVRLEPGSWRLFGLTTLGILALIFYSIYCDPLWSIIGGMSWSVPFAIVTFGTTRVKTVLIRLGALCCCFAVLFLTGMAEYLYTLSKNTARVQFMEALDRVRGGAFVSTLFYSPYMKYFYLLCLLGWLLGLVTCGGRARLLVVAAVGSSGVLLVYSVIYLLLLNAPWVPPIPIYIEQSLFVLFMTSAIAGYSGAFTRVARVVAARAGLKKACAHGRGTGHHSGIGAPSLNVVIPPRSNSAAPLSGIRAVMINAGLIIAIVPVAVAGNGLILGNRMGWLWYEPWPKEPEFVRFFAENIGLKVGRPFRGAIEFGYYDYPTANTIFSLWARGIPTIFEYDQLVTAQAMYFLRAVLQQNVVGSLNGFAPSPGASWDNYWKSLQLFGARYYVAGYEHSSEADSAGYAHLTLPRRPFNGKPGLWHVYELPRPNVGNYSPTEIVVAGTGAESAEKMRGRDFDFTKQVVLPRQVSEHLVQARDTSMSRIRGGLRVSGKSAGTSLVVLPQQFSNCLHARDERVRLIRANLMMTGVLFSGDLDTDIVFDYGIFTPGCRLADLADTKRLDLKIDQRMAHLSGDNVFPSWNGAIAKLRAVAAEIK
jgi:hypothetical protein